MEVGELLRKIRGKDSLREAKEKTGLSHNYISIIEKGIDPRSGAPIKPSPDTLKAYEKGYNYSYEELMKAAGYLTEEEKEIDELDAVDQLARYLEMELSNEDIITRLNFKVDGMYLTPEEAIEFVEFVRVRRAMKKQRQTVSKGEEL